MRRQEWMRYRRVGKTGLTDEMATDRRGASASELTTVGNLVQYPFRNAFQNQTEVED